MILAILAPLVGVAGAILLSFGVWQIYPPGGYVMGGALCLVWSWLVSRAMARLPQGEHKGDE